MTTMTRRTAALAAALVLAVAGPAFAAAPPQEVLGAEGELFRIEQGPYGELMSRPRSPQAANSVLVLRIQRPDQQDALHPLPATLGPDVESAAALLYEEASDTLYVAWESRTNLIHSQIRLAGFTNGAWGDPIDVSDRRFSFKSFPRLAVTRDVFELRDADDEAVSIRRTVLHVAWVEERAEGLAVVYSPVVLIDGAHEGPGPGPIFALTELVAPAPEDLLPVPLAELPLQPAVEPGRDDHSVVIGFVHPASGRLTTVDLTLLSGDVSSLADRARAHIIELGNRIDARDPGALGSLAGGARAHIIELGSRVEPTVRAFVADRVRVHILEIGDDADLADQGDVESLAGDARAHIIELGARLEGRGLRLNTLIATPLILDLPPAAEGPSHQIGFGVVSSRSLEGLRFAGTPVVLLSADGADALIAWEAGGQLRYQESRGQGWSAVRAIALATIDRERALEIVQHRIRNR